MAMQVLLVKNLRIHIFSRKYKSILEDVSFSVRCGEVLGIIGESAAGKSMAMKAITGLIPPSMKIVGGEIFLNNKEITAFTEKEWKNIRGNEIFLISQNSRTSLNPVISIFSQFDEFIAQHSRFTRKKRKEIIFQSLEKVGFTDIERIVHSFAHQLSGGMIQRIFLAMALSLKPVILILDEATSALDKQAERGLLEKVKNIKEQGNIAIILITHDINVISGLADKVAVLYSGETVEFGKAADIFRNPRHPYTRVLFKAKVRGTKADGNLYEIPGEKIEMYFDKCNFSNRCPLVRVICSYKKPQLINGVRCVLYE